MKRDSFNYAIEKKKKKEESSDGQFHRNFILESHNIMLLIAGLASTLVRSGNGSSKS